MTKYWEVLVGVDGDDRVERALAEGPAPLTGTAPPLRPAAYAAGVTGCAFAAVLGHRGRTRRALWLLVAGTTVMALGDQSD